MAIFDGSTQWFSGFQTAATSLATALAGAAAAIFALRRKYSSDTADIAGDRTETKLLHTLMAERNAAVNAAKDALDVRIENASSIARLEVQLQGCEQRATKCDEAAHKFEERAIAAEERARSLTEQVLMLNIDNDRAHAELVKMDPQLAERLSSARWKPPAKTEQT